ncbi:MAG TPA: HAD family hydrolase [Candidatus Saccharimonadales bacterium]|nr:HAD family hydrolase [Candidatus Saccharimonadales bacterium]
MRFEGKDVVLACDVDGTLVADYDRPSAEREQGAAYLAELCEFVESERALGEHEFYFGSATGRSIGSHRSYEESYPPFGAAASIMDFKVTGVGSEAYLMTAAGERRLPDWPDVSEWDREGIVAALAGRVELALQHDRSQLPYKISYFVDGVTDAVHDAYVAEIAERLSPVGVGVQVVFSDGKHLDILPEGVNKGTCLLHVVSALERAHAPSEVESGEAEPTAQASMYIVSAGNSMNDCDLLRVADLAILPGNAHDSLRQWAQETISPEQLYIAEGNLASSILEGLHHIE